MSWLDYPAYLRFIESESARFRDALTSSAPDAVVPHCPGWDADTLFWHLTEVQQKWATLVRQRPTGPETLTPATRPDSRAGLIEASLAATTALLDALGEATAEEETWTWSTDHTAGFVARRQAHEALIHRLDAEQTIGDPTPMDPHLAADGVLEILDVMYGRRPAWGEFSPLPHYVKIELTDVDRVIWVQLGRLHGTDPDGVSHHEDDISVVDDPGVDADAVISGAADILDARLWRRGLGDALHVGGDLGILDHFRGAIHHPI